MAEPFIDMDIRQSLAMQRGLELLSRHGGDLRRPVALFGIYSRNKTDETFRGRGRGAVRWEPLADSTIESRKRRHRNATNILQDSGDLRRKIEVDTFTDLFSFISSQRSQQHYGLFHQEGTKTIPQRRFLFYTPADITFSKRLILDHVRRVVSRSLKDLK